MLCALRPRALLGGTEASKLRCKRPPSSDGRRDPSASLTQFLPCGAATDANKPLKTPIRPYFRLHEARFPARSAEASLTSKGQTTISKEIRDRLHMKVGDRMTCTLLPDGTVLMRVKNKSVMDVAGRLHKKGRKALSVEQLSR